MDTAINIIKIYAKYFPYPMDEKFLISEDNGIQYVYLIRNPLTSHVKIGITGSIIDRARDIKNTSGIEVEMIMYLKLVPGEDEKPKIIEGFLHNYYHDLRRIGEYFELTNKDIFDIYFLFIEWIDPFGIWVSEDYEAKLKVFMDDDLEYMLSGIRNKSSFNS